MSSQATLITQLRADLAAATDAERAAQMRKYLKSALPMLGLRRPRVRALVTNRIAAYPNLPRESWQGAAETLWREAAFREERYAAIDVTGARQYRWAQDFALIGLYEEFVVSGAWWDLVDEVATDRLGPILRTDPEAGARYIHAWSRHDDMWLRRTAIICQIGAKDDTDRVALTDAIEVNAAESDFFIRKAIGWALRQYAKTDPQWVRDFLAVHTLSPLSLREASKHL